MPIKSNCECKERIYPMLFEYSNCGDSYIVLFSEPCVGTVLKSNIDEKHVGYHSEHFYMGSFHPYNGKLVLENI